MGLRLGLVDERISTRLGICGNLSQNVRITVVEKRKFVAVLTFIHFENIYANISIDISSEDIISSSFD